MHDAPMAELLLQGLPKGTSLLADRGYDANWIRELIEDQDCTPVIPPKSNRVDDIPFSKRKYCNAIWSNAASTSSSSFATSQPAMTAGLQPIWLSQNSPPCDCGCGFMSPQPKELAPAAPDRLGSAEVEKADWVRFRRLGSGGGFGLGSVAIGFPHRIQERKLRKANAFPNRVTGALDVPANAGIRRLGFHQGAVPCPHTGKNRRLPCLRAKRPRTWRGRRTVYTTPMARG